MRWLAIIGLLCSCIACLATGSMAEDQDCGSVNQNANAPVFALQHGRFGCPANGNFALIFHSGAVYPHGDLKKTNDVGWSTDVQATFPISGWPRWGWNLGAQYSHFPGDAGQSEVSVADFSGNLSFVLLRSKQWLFLNAGPGAYYVHNGNVHPGFNAGIGLDSRYDQAEFLS